jgi:hypothetical protein
LVEADFEVKGVGEFRDAAIGNIMSELRGKRELEGRGEGKDWGLFGCCISSHGMMGWDRMGWPKGVWDLLRFSHDSIYTSESPVRTSLKT